MVEPNNAEEQNTSLGMEGIDIKLEDYNETSYPKTKGSETAEGQVDTGKVKDDEEEAKARIGGFRPENNFLNREESKWEKACPYLSLRPIAPYFDVDSVTIRKRMISSLIPFKYDNFY